MIATLTELGAIDVRQDILLIPTSHAQQLTVPYPIVWHVTMLFAVVVTLITNSILLRMSAFPSAVTSTVLLVLVLTSAVSVLHHIALMLLDCVSLTAPLSLWTTAKLVVTFQPVPNAIQDIPLWLQEVFVWQIVMIPTAFTA